MLEDKKLLEDVESYIRREKANAEWAVKVAADQILSIYSEIKDDYLRERGSDIEDVTRRILAALSGERQTYDKLTKDAVVVAEDLLPSAVAELDLNHARALATDTGGWTSHTSIIARGLGIPAVVGLRDLHRRARTGDRIIIDALNGEVYLHPSAETVAHFERLNIDRVSAPKIPIDASSGLVRSLDGVEIALRANVELPAEYEGVGKFGAHGIGLYRSEFLMSHSGRLPTEDEQYRAYIEVGRVGGKEGATIRLFDLGGDKIGMTTSESERNPALGLRAIRFILKSEQVFRDQARAILRAAATVPLRLVLPMVSDVSDVRKARSIIDEETEALVRHGFPVGSVEIGAMIEVPSAVMTVDSISREVDFLSLGTNDLVQYLLAVDRGNEEVADWFRSLHPSVLHSIKRTVDAAQKFTKPLTVCGEMAGTPAYALVLLGLGATELSMTASLIPRMRRMVTKVDIEAAKTVADLCLNADTADDVEEIIRVEFGQRWPDVFPPKSLPPPQAAH
jgi:phosphotransferase system enzyme I (PtsI)